MSFRVCTLLTYLDVASSVKSWLLHFSSASLQWIIQVDSVI